MRPRDGDAGPARRRRDARSQGGVPVPAGDVPNAGRRGDERAGEPVPRPVGEVWPERGVGSETDHGWRDEARRDAEPERAGSVDDGGEYDPEPGRSDHEVMGSRGTGFGEPPGLSR